MNALIIGRFQPFHNGHLKMIKTINCDKIIIAIGSSQYSNTTDNPFSFKERKEMIEKTLEEEEIENFKIIKIPDIHNPPKWVDHVLSIYSDFDVVYTNSNFIEKLFLEKKIDVKNTELFDRKNLSGKIIRQKIKNNEDWESYVPSQVKKIIKNINGEQRIKNLNS